VHPLVLPMAYLSLKGGCGLSVGQLPALRWTVSWVLRISGGLCVPHLLAPCFPCLGVLAGAVQVANCQVRNVGSVIGNLMLTRSHPEFTSDVATLMAGCGASLAVAVVGAPLGIALLCVDALSFVRREAAPPAVNDDQNVVVLSLHIPALRQARAHLLSYKVAQRRRQRSCHRQCRLHSASGSNHRSALQPASRCDWCLSLTACESLSSSHHAQVARACTQAGPGMETPFIPIVPPFHAHGTPPSMPMEPPLHAHGTPPFMPMEPIFSCPCYPPFHAHGTPLSCPL